MGALQDFERRLEGAVEGFFARAFRSGLQPIELAKAVQRYAADTQHVTSDGVVVPNVYRVRVSPKDHERLRTYGEALGRELGEVVVTTASDHGWLLRGPAKVRVLPDEEIHVGRYAVTGRVESVEDQRADAPSPPAAPAGAGAAGLDRTQVVNAAPRTASLALRVTTGPDAGTTVPISGSRVTLGRQSSCTVPLHDGTVSREHAALVRRAEGWWIVDLGSTNGTRVNGATAAEQQVRPGDRIELGDVVVELTEG